MNNKIKNKIKFATKVNKSSNIKTVNRVFDKWTRNKAILNLSKWTSERGKSVTTPKIVLITDRVKETPSKSVRKFVEGGCKARDNDCQNDFKEGTKIEPYQIGMLWTLSHKDTERRL